MKQTFMIITLTIIASTVVTLLMSTPLTLLVWTNTLFVCSLIVTITGAILFIIQVGFFNGFIENFRYFTRKTSRVEQVADQVERKNTNTPLFSIKFLLTYPLLAAGITLILISTFFSIIL